MEKSLKELKVELEAYKIALTQIETVPARTYIESGTERYMRFVARNALNAFTEIQEND